MNDLCGGHRCEVNALVTILKGGLLWPFKDSKFHHNDFLLKDLASKIETDCGFNEKLSLWAAESWALALGWLTEEQSTKEVRCPFCKFPAQAQRYWQNSQAICPNCKSEIYFDNQLVPQLKKQGSSTSTDETTANWILIDTKSHSRSLSEQQLEAAINSVLDNASLPETAKCERLQLRRVLARLEHHIDPILEEIRGAACMGLGSRKAVLTNTLMGFAPLPGLFVGDEISEHTLQNLKQVCHVPPVEEVIGLIEFTCFGNDTIGMVFGSGALYYCNGAESAFPGAGTISYEQLSLHPAQPTGLQELTFGDLQAGLHLAGSGLSKATMVTLLRIVGLLLGNNPRNRFRP